jgi:hypothetical protein
MDIKKNTSTGIVVFALVIIVAIVLIWRNSNKTEEPNVALFDKSISDGVFTLAYPSEDFGMATKPEQILVTSYIPPCNSDFNYCLYHIGQDYAGSNLESAGIRVEKRTDLPTENVCLTTPPGGFSATTAPSDTNAEDAFSSSVFDNVGDAGAGHYATGSLYRLFYRADSSCYEFETRIGESQFANYPAGTIKEFTDADRTALKSKLTTIVKAIKLPNGSVNLWKL